MRNKKMDQLILQMENYLECWKQFNYFVNLGRSKKFSPEDEAQFLEVKSVIAQEMELIFSSMEFSTPTKEEVLNILASAPSIRYLSEMNEGSIRSIENQWHKIYIGWQSILGQLKAKQRDSGSSSMFSSLFGKRS
jgi:hypothetical protein